MLLNAFQKYPISIDIVNTRTPARSTTKNQADTERIGSDDTAGQSSPCSHLFVSSPRSPVMPSSVRSRSSSVASLDAQHQVGLTNGKEKKSFISSDEESSSDEEAEGDDDATFLANFRARQARSALKPSDSPLQDGKAIASSVFSGSLSEPPSLHSNDVSTPSHSTQETPLPATTHSFDDEHNSEDDDQAQSPSPRKRFLRKSMLPATPFDSEENAAASQGMPVTYISEAQKLRDEANKKLERARKLKKLAARNRAVREEQESSQVNAAEDEISSSSDIDVGSVRAALGRISKAGKARGQAVLQMNDIESNGDLSDLEIAGTRQAIVHPKQLSKKDADEMVRIQARIEREKRTSNARSAHVPRKVGTFSINDLIANIGAAEARRHSPLEQSRSAKADSPSSDPIQSSSSEAEADKSTSFRPVSLSSKSVQPFYVRIREVSGEKDAKTDLVGEIQDDASRERYKFLQEAKRLAMTGTSARAESLIDANNDDDIIELVSTSSEILRKASPVHASEMDSGDETISASQVHRAGRLLKILQSDAQRNSEEKQEVKSSKGNERKIGRKIAVHKRRDLEDLILKRMEQQNLEAKRKKEESLGRRSDQPNDIEKKGVTDINALLETFRQEAECSPPPSEGGEDDDSDFQPEAGSEPGEDDAESERGSDSEGNTEKLDLANPQQKPHDSVPPTPIKVGKRRNRVLEDDEEELVGLHKTTDEDGITAELLSAVGDGDLAEFFAATPEANELNSESVADEGDLGQFFQDTQTDAPLRGESFAVLPIKSSDFAATSTMMPPPTTSARGLSLLQGSDNDGFAALRRAQANDALRLDDEPEDLPALHDILQAKDEEEIMALELEAMRADAEQRQAQQMREAAANDVTYINKDGFFTQTRPESFSYSLTQDQSQDVLESSVVDSLNTLENLRAPEALQQTKKRRFRGAVSTSSDEDQSYQPGEPDDTDRGEGDDAEVYDDTEEHNALSQQESAFDIMKRAAAERLSSRKKEESERAARQFVQGEAEESDDDSEGVGGRRTTKHGGLGGVFSDDERGSADEDEDDEDDGADLESLIDEDRDDDEAEKDELARERYQQDMDEDEKAALALHERATKGAFRTKRRARNNEDGALEGFLDEDYEDDWLEKVAKNPYGQSVKKRKLDGKDGMDLLSQREDSLAFVKEYRESHQDSSDLNESYSFLLEADEADEESQQAILEEIGRRRTIDDDDENDGDDDKFSASERAQIITHQEFREAIAVRRRARKQRAYLRAMDDEADLEEAQRLALEEKQREEALRRNIEKALYDPDEDEMELSVRVKVNDRISSGKRKANPFGDTDRGVGDDDEADEDSPGLGVLNMRRSNTSEREKQRLARLAQDYANEPDWRSAKEAIARTRHAAVRTTAANRAVTANAGNQSRSLPPRQSSSSSSVHSRLRKVLSRKGQFSESQ